MSNTNGDSVSTAARIGELKQLVKAYESEISCLQLYQANPDRMQQEIAKEELKLRWQQEKVDRLKAKAANHEQQIAQYHDKIASTKKQIIELRNQNEIEKMIALQAELLAAGSEGLTLPQAAAAMNGQVNHAG